MKIGRIRKGEKIIVLRISEPLQEKFNALKCCGVDLEGAMKEIYEIKKLGVEIPVEKIIEGCRLNLLMEKLSADFWWDLNSNYNLYNYGGLGIRDGYCIVQLPERKNPEVIMEEITKLLKSKLKELTGDEDDDKDEKDED